jgi:hypothetical protein
MIPTKHSEPDAADKDFFERLRHEVECQIADYIYAVPEGAVGTPLSLQDIRADLELMRLCLVEPRWEEVLVCSTSEELRSGVGDKRMCVTMAEDKGYVSNTSIIWRGGASTGWGLGGCAEMQSGVLFLDSWR